MVYMYHRLGVRTVFFQSPLLFFPVNVTVTVIQCCHTPVYGVIALTWAVMRWDQVSICTGNIPDSLAEVTSFC